MNRKAVKTPGAPAAIGSYSQAVVSGDLVFCSGQIPLDPSTGELDQGSAGDATRRCLRSLAAVLEAAGAGLGDVVKVSVYLTDLADFTEFNDAYGEFFGADPPARAAVGVAALPKDARIEIECVARLP